MNGTSNGTVTAPHPEQSALTIRLEGANWFSRSRPAWSELLANSRANRLFLGWDWQYRWWAHFGRELQAQPLIITASNDAGTLVGIAPFFTRESSERRLRSAIQLAPIGNVWRMNLGEVTEHTDWIVRTEWEETAPREMSDYLLTELQWDEILIAYTSPRSLISKELDSLARRASCYVRREQPLRHYSIDTSRTFDQFIRVLGKNTRQRVYTRRNLLSRLGAVELVHADRTNLATQLEKLERLSRKRWGRGFLPSMRGFYEELSGELLRERQLQFSTLEVDGRPISALFDVDADGVRYNVRSAIDASFDRRLSPGLLHLGYSIEDACRRNGIVRYALLAGEGKHTDFKRHLAEIVEDFTSFQIVRRPHEKLLYKLYDRLIQPVLAKRPDPP